MATETARPTVLVVDDESGIRDALAQLLTPRFDVMVAADGAEALRITSSHKLDLMVLDAAMPDGDGLSVLQSLRASRLKIPVIMVSAAASVRQAVTALKAGATDFLSKPFEPSELTSLIDEVLQRSFEPSSDEPLLVRGASRKQKMKVARSPVDGDFGTLVGRSPVMERLYDRIERVAAVDATVLISGESGTGKELVARHIHSMSARRDGPFIPVNCAAIPDALIESELFGHEKGAFTNAVNRRIGLCEVADGGTLFLDEIGDISPSNQVKLLRFMQEQEFFRVGSSVPTRVDVRILSATNRNLEELVQQGLFREDLWYRVNVVGVTVPALRDRVADIPHIFDVLVERLSASYGGRRLVVTTDALEQLLRYPWPGNVRELQNVVENLLALAASTTVTLEDLPAKIRMVVDSTMHRDLPTGSLESDARPFQDAEREFETEIILRALKQANFVQSRAAILLGISRRILKYKMDKLGISGTLKGEPEDS